MSKLVDSPIWQARQAHRQEMAKVHMRELFAGHDSSTDSLINYYKHLRKESKYV